MRKKLVKIGRVSVESAIGFGYDGCHKFYVADTVGAVAALVEDGYTVYPMDKLEEKFKGSCPLRFISLEDLEKPDIVRQGCGRVTFTYCDGTKKTKSVVRFN